MKLTLHRSGTDGSAVVLLHGVPGSAGVWQGVAQALASDHRVFVADLARLRGELET